MVDAAFWRGKKVFLTGHTGFKGSWLTMWLHALGAKVTGYALEPPTDPSLYVLAGVAQLVDSEIADVRDGGRLTASIATAAPDVVIHMAAQPLVRESYAIPVETYATNVMGTVNLLEGVRTCPSVKAVVVVTTDKCYENREWVWGYREDERLGGYDPYSNSKACCELVTASYRSSFFNSSRYQDHGVAVATTRAGNVIGGGDWAEGRLIPDCVKAILTGETIRIRYPHAIRPWQHVLEPLSGYLSLARKLYQEGPAYAEAWNFGPYDDDAQPVEWIVKGMCARWGKEAGYQVEGGEHPHEAHYLKLDCSKARNRLQWQPRWRLGEALDAIIEWTHAYQQQQDLQAICLRQIEAFSAKQPDTITR